MIKILSNGAHWANEKPDSVASLLQLLKEYSLDRRFEDCGNFVQRRPQWVDFIPNEHGYGGVTRPVKANPYPGRKVVVFFGGFLGHAAVFNIHTDDQPVIKKLAAAIQANQKRADYLAQPKPGRGEK